MKMSSVMKYWKLPSDKLSSAEWIIWMGVSYFWTTVPSQQNIWRRLLVIDMYNVQCKPANQHSIKCMSKCSQPKQIYHLSLHKWNLYYHQSVFFPFSLLFYAHNCLSASPPPPPHPPRGTEPKMKTGFQKCRFKIKKFHLHASFGSVMIIYTK